MKRTILYFFFLTLSIPGLAQETQQNHNNKIETLINDSDYHSGGYGGPVIKYTKFVGQNAIVVGGRGGWIINHSFSIGGAGYGLVTAPEVTSYKPVDSTDTRAYYLRTGWGGLFLEYTFYPMHKFHFAVNTLIGAGAVSCAPSTDEHNYGNKYNNVPDYPSSTYFVLEPGFGIEMNVLQFFRVEIGCSYRFTQWMNMDYMGPSDINGFSGSLAFKFGSF